MKTNLLKTTGAVFALFCAILLGTQLTASPATFYGGGNGEEETEQNVPYNALGKLYAGGGIQVFVNKVYPYMLDGTPVQWVQIYQTSGIFAFVRRGETSTGGRRTEFVALELSSGFLVYTPKKFRTCFSPDCGGEVTSQPDGNGNEIAVGGGFGFCTPNQTGNACQCAGGYDCTFGISGESVGIEDVVLY